MNFDFNSSYTALSPQCIQTSNPNALAGVHGNLRAHSTSFILCLLPSVSEFLRACPEHCESASFYLLIRWKELTSR